jgi:DNA-binding transcriptional ArsR family regulator/rhodanese-related sulfurtransferase
MHIVEVKLEFDESTEYAQEAEILKVLGHPIRLKIVAGLCYQACNVKRIWECLGLSQATVSQHLALLKNKGVIHGTREGVEVHYSVVNDFARELVDVLLQTGRPAAHAANYLEAAVFKGWLDGGRKIQIVDVQPQAEYAQRHFNDSIATNAFPGKTEEEKKRLDPALKIVAASEADVVIVCPRGSIGSNNAYRYLLEQGIAEKRLHILEKGMTGWPYPELLERE